LPFRRCGFLPLVQVTLVFHLRKDEFQVEKTAYFENGDTIPKISNRKDFIFKKKTRRSGF
jgi:hypothetical protein